MKKRLFIFGNGFDIMHQNNGQLNTNYSNFRTWLISKCSNFVEDEEYDFDLPNYITNYKHLEDYDESEFAKFFIKLVDDADNTICEADEWQHFEDSLGLLNWDLVLNNVIKEYDEDGKLDNLKMQDNYTSLAMSAGESNHILSEFFKKWIFEVNSDLSKISKNHFFEDVHLSNDDFFLNFNYTSTLEDVYGISNVCHIHGYAKNYDTLIVGHGKNSFERPDDDVSKDYAFEVFESIFTNYKKRPFENIKKHKVFFDNIEVVDEIYILGISFGEADLQYFNYIFKNTNAKSLFLFVYKDDEYEEKCKKIKELGFAGKIINWKLLN